MDNRLSYKLEYDDALPITKHRAEIVEAIRTQQLIIVAGETGSGKTTQLPKFCLEAGRGTRGMIASTQPRRIAARAMAERVAEELGSELGQVVGYQVRFRQKIGKSSRIKFMTDGILLAETTGDRKLHAYDTIIIDEAHERSLNIDFLLGYLKQLLPRRPDLRVIITSATIDTEKFSKHFDDAPVIEVTGRGYPVEVIYQPFSEPEAEGELRNRDMYRGIADAVGRLSRKDARGDILVFLSGEREIHEAGDYLVRKGLRHTEVLPLFSRLSAAEQRRIFHPGPQRRIILSTNIAETSLTVPRIRYVIDTGFVRISRYSHRSRIQRLPIEPVSQASANQRLGRCGRLGPGICVRLYSQEDFDLRAEFTEPEILRTSLASIILRMLTMNLGEIEQFPFIDPPAPRMINDAYHLLFELGAVDKAQKPTKTGRKLARWPLDVRLGRMVLEGDRQSCLEDILVLAAGLSIQDPRERPLDARAAADQAHDRFSDEKSDFAAMLKLWLYVRKQRKERTGNQFRKLCRKEFLNWQRVLEWIDLYQQLRDQAREQGMALDGKHGNFEQVHIALLSGLLSHVGQKHPQQPFYTGARNRHFHIFPGSGLFGRSPKWVMSAEIVETTKPYGRINAAIDPQWLERQAAHLLKYSYQDPHWSRRRGRVMAWQQISMFGLVLVEKRRVSYARVDALEARRIFVLEALVRGELDTRRGFAQHNLRLREEIDLLEKKRRSRDVLVDEASLFAFFDARIPQDVNSTRSLEAWLESLPETDRNQLLLSHDVLMRENAGEAPANSYPDTWVQGQQAFPLSYHFSPGDERDGVTITAPIELLNTLDPGQLQWLVPGLLREKVIEIIRNLPKPVRRSLTPAPQFADAALDGIADRNGSLFKSLATSLQQLTGMEISVDLLAAVPIPEYLKFRIVMTGNEGEIIAVSRNLEELQERFGQKAQRRFMDQEGQGWNRDGEVSWEFGDLPVSVKTSSGNTAWPALSDQQNSVGLRLFDTEVDAHFAHLEGVRRLVGIGIKDKLQYLQKHHGISQQALMVWSVYDSPAGLVSDLVWACLGTVADPSAVSVRDEHTFNLLVETCRSSLGGEFQSQAAQLEEVLNQTGVILNELNSGLSETRPRVFEDLSGQLEDLVYPGFLLDLAPGRLMHYPRYLAAMKMRLDSLRLDPSRDAKLQSQVEPYWQRYLERITSGAEYDESLDSFRWLIEEFRVSLFAQSLGTAQKTSAKRLDEAWCKVTSGA